MDESIEEEERIMEERASTRPSVGPDVFHHAIEMLDLRPVETLDVSATVADALARMQRERIGSVVITEGGKLAGIVTERDVLMKVVGNAERSHADPITTIMTANPECLRKDDPIAYVMNRMHVGGFRHVPIVDAEGRPTHVVSIRDALAYLLHRFREDVVNIPPDPFRGTSERWSG